MLNFKVDTKILKVVIAVIVLAVGGYLVYHFFYKKKDDNAEAWAYNGLLTQDVSQNVVVNGQVHQLPKNSMLGNPANFVQVPKYQGMLAPRFGNVDYNSTIRYDVPDKKNQAVPETPLTFGQMAGVNTSCGANVTENYESDNAYESLPSVLEPNDLPVASMTMTDVMGNAEQALVFDRVMPTIKKNRLWGQADLIRGDLPIVPNKGNWFNVSPTVHTALNAGALNVMAGHNEASEKLASLIVPASGGTQQTFAGVALSPADMQQKMLNFSNAMNDVQVMVYP